MNDHSATSAGLYGLIWMLPFVGLLLTIATAPLAVPRLWHAHYGKAAGFWAMAFLVPDVIATGAPATFHSLTETVLHEFLPFVLLLGALFVITGGIRLRGAPVGAPGVNTALLAIGTVMASLIGTTGAAMMMLRPLIRANRHRQNTTHVFVFFIFLVGNVGGALSPLGDPPLLLGYLKGVPFFWPTVHLLAPTLVMAAGLLATFYALDRYTHRRSRRPDPAVLPEIEKLGIEGAVNLPLLAGAIAAILLQAFWSPAGGLVILGVTWRLVDIVTAGLLIALAGASLAFGPASARRGNGFTWGPIVEVALLFAAIFVTLIPVAAIMAAGGNGPAAPLFAAMMPGGMPDAALFYRVTGLFSAFLDNAPTYLVFFGLAGGDPSRLAGPLAGTLAAISAGAVYFGALSYIGNAPNLMVKAIVESQGLRMPSFLGYIGWSLVCLLPWLLLVEAIFFH